ncbi:MAG: curli-like amyloid fiber formation chaperone CsgH [Rhodobacterales bacterium]|nr:curli-like amyloid fiber formation chaperone CsgH [Rhodobacterales bacterium]
MALTSLTKLIIPATALLASLGMLTVTSTAHSGGEASVVFAAPLPVTCQILVSKTRGGNTYKGVVSTSETINGTYEMRFSKNSGGGRAVINQSGRFNVAAGTSVTVGEATFGGIPSQVDADLSLRWSNQTLTCFTDSDA